MKTFLLALSLLISLNLMGQKLQLPVGMTFAFERGQAAKGGSHSVAKDVYNFRVLGIDKKGNYRLECVLRQAKLNEPLRNGTLNNMDTEQIQKTRFESTSTLIPLSLLGKPFEVVLDSAGRVVDLSGLQALVQREVDKWDLQPQIKAGLLHNLSLLRFEIGGLFTSLSPNNISYPSSWTDEKSQMRYEVTGVKGHLLMIGQRLVPQDSTQPALRGEIVINTRTGLKEWRQIHLTHLTDKPSADNETISTQTLVQYVDVPPVDTAWVNMAVRMSWMSASLMNGAEYDSSKVFRAIKQYDPIYLNDPYYALNKLGAIQQVRINEADTLYYEQLRKTPTHLLASNSSHLFNKIGNVLSLGVDSAYLVATYLYKYPSFTDWIQNSFAQRFSGEGGPSTSEQWEGFTRHYKARGWTDEAITKGIEEAENASRNSLPFLQKMNTSPVDSISRAVRPLHLWVEAKKNAGKKRALVRAAQELEQMKTGMFVAGNGGRYSLLVYGMLLESGEKNRASALLNRLIPRLELLAADSLNTDRYAHQNLLAHAWFLKYQESAAVDSAAALRYLAEASRCSPKVTAEQAYVSFYDRFFLKSKESYKADYLEALVKRGDKSTASDVIVELINVSPERLTDVQKLYESHFTDQRFANFYRSRIVSSWPAAPDFQLKGPDGKLYGLKDYSGKWLLLDFWGTWCAPCRAEMPSLNSFSQEINEGRYPDVSFLSIACRDTDRKVLDYFSANKFSIPVAMSDGSIEKNYPIRGYPSKLIVSPEGRMLALSFGVSWKDVLLQLSSFR